MVGAAQTVAGVLPFADSSSTSLGISLDEGKLSPTQAESSIYLSPSAAASSSTRSPLVAIGASFQVALYEKKIARPHQR